MNPDRPDRICWTGEHNVPRLAHHPCFVALALATEGSVAETRLQAAVEPADLKLIERVTWGINESSAADFNSLGRDAGSTRKFGPQRLITFPRRSRPSSMRCRLRSLPRSQLAIALAAQARAANQIQDAEQKKAAQQDLSAGANDLAKQAATRSLLRDLYSPNQLREKMTWFWLDHFSAFQNKSDIRVLIGDYEEHAIRPHALGRFRDLLAATASHPVMLRYLDNTDARGHINENYAREIMELHTMGVGSGYTQEDVAGTCAYPNRCRN